MSLESDVSSCRSWGRTAVIPASSPTIAWPIGCVAPVTTQTKPYNLPSERYGEKWEEIFESGMVEIRNGDADCVGWGRGGS